MLGPRNLFSADWPYSSVESERPMALKEQSDLARDERFMRRVQVAMCSVAIRIHAEPVDTPHHLARAAYSRGVLNDPERYMSIFSIAACAFDGKMNSASHDTAIFDAVIAVWNALAGTSTEERPGVETSNAAAPIRRRALGADSSRVDGPGETARPAEV